MFCILPVMPRFEQNANMGWEGDLKICAAFGILWENPSFIS